jgi:UDP-glucose 4-epimerase
MTAIPPMKQSTTQGNLLITGGAGYIGSHVVAKLGARGENIVVLDNLSTGNPRAVLHGRLIVGDVGDAALVTRVLREYEIETVMHFAAKIVVPESVAHPLDYYDTNTARARVLFDACRAAGVKHVVFSSTAAVYGDPAGGVANEETPPAPMNPYGRSKLMSEWMLRDLAQVTDLRYVALRYFNVAGCDLRGRIGQDTPEATHLIKVACQHAVGTRASLQIYGTDYDTPDGTCIRDYIHVEDLADAHLAALDYLRDGGRSLTANCGYGHGFSVRDVIDVLARLVGHPLMVVEAPRRPGDMSKIIADASLARRVLNWQPRCDDLTLIVSSALAWERHRLRQPLPRHRIEREERALDELARLSVTQILRDVGAPTRARQAGADL